MSIIYLQGPCYFDIRYISRLPVPLSAQSGAGKPRKCMQNADRLSGVRIANIGWNEWDGKGASCYFDVV